MGPIDREAAAALLLAVAFLSLAAVDVEPCSWQPERGFERDYHVEYAECLWDHHRAERMAELCNYKLANRGLVRWVCRK